MLGLNITKDNFVSMIISPNLGLRLSSLGGNRERSINRNREVEVRVIRMPG